MLAGVTDFRRHDRAGHRGWRTPVTRGGCWLWPGTSAGLSPAAFACGLSSMVDSGQSGSFHGWLAASNRTKSTEIPWLSLPCICHFRCILLVAQLQGHTQVGPDSRRRGRDLPPRQKESPSAPTCFNTALAGMEYLAQYPAQTDTRSVLGVRQVPCPRKLVCLGSHS